MTVQPVNTLLRRVNKDSANFYTVAGCQLLFREATLKYEQTTRHITRVESTRQMLAEMAHNCRTELQEWHVTPSCSRMRPACRSGSCGCSYQWIARLSAFLTLQKEKEKQLSSLKHDALCYRHLANKVIASHFARICTIPVFVMGFAEAMYLAGTISSDEWNFISTFGDDAILHGTPFEPRLTVGTFNQSLTICWDQSGERVYH